MSSGRLENYLICRRIDFRIFYMKSTFYLDKSIKDKFPQIKPTMQKEHILWIANWS